MTNKNNIPTNAKLTLCIPTKNRSEFLSRLLHYYANTNYQHWIFIGDASNATHYKATQQTIKSLEDRLKVRHFEQTGMDVAQSFDSFAHLISTPFSAACADDDFILTQGIEKCIRFMEDNPDYSAAHGKGIAFSLNQSGPYGKIRQVHFYPQTIQNAKTGKERLFNVFNISASPVVLSVHRTKDWRDMWGAFTGSRQGFIFEELVPSGISVIRGKVKELDNLYLVRQGHDAQYPQENIFDWVTNPDWQSTYSIMRDKFIIELMQQDGIIEAEAREAVKNAFWPFLARIIRDRLPRDLKIAESGSRVRAFYWTTRRRLGQNIPALKTIYIKMISLIQIHLHREKDFNLNALLNPSSKYHENFKAVYKVITTFKQNNK